MMCSRCAGAGTWSAIARCTRAIEPAGGLGLEGRALISRPTSVTTRHYQGPLRARFRLWRRTRREGALLIAPFRITGLGRDDVLDIIQIGKGTRIGQFAWFSLVSRDARLEIGEGGTLGAMVSFTVKERITIGDGTAIGDRTLIADHGHDHLSYLSEALEEGEAPAFGWGVTEASPVVIGAGVHVGVGVVILPGVTIGDGCVIGANSVVTKSVPAYSVAAGVPAKVIKTLAKGPTDGE